MTKNEAIECTWKKLGDGDWDIWETDCGHSFYFDDGGSPKEDGFVYCPYCGKRITILEGLKDKEQEK